MEDPSASPSSPAHSPAAEQARLRKARRDAKIRAGGSERLSKITSMGGRPSMPASPAPSTSSPAPSPNPSSASVNVSAAAQNQFQPSAAADPEEVTISEHFYKPASARRRQQPQAQQEGPQPNEDQIRQLMLGISPSGGAQNGAHPNPFGMPPGGEEDPMAKMLAQMLGAVPGAGGGPLGMGMGMGASMGQEQMPTNGQRATNIWRIVHVLFALGLGAFLVWGSGFTGRKIERSRRADEEGIVQAFWLFATGELILQSTRFWLEGSRLVGGGMLATVAGFLPSPYGEYITVVGRYFIIFSTLISDALVVVFILGAAAWWRGG
ncbi:MAG: hypothetical protein M1814_001216 [Vezdaea aestivalis]|nr:MAG: hypothetical protein M1814_001216 [Vezdaea aestivalis]